MNNPAPTRSTFVLRVWIEYPDPNSTETRWRGLITLIPSGEKRYVNNLCEVAQFINWHLKSLGVRQPGFIRTLMAYIGSRRAARMERDDE